MGYPDRKLFLAAGESPAPLSAGEEFIALAHETLKL
jgi:hypothetical protein